MNNFNTSRARARPYMLMSPFVPDPTLCFLLFTMSYVLNLTERFSSLRISLTPHIFKKKKLGELHQSQTLNSLARLARAWFAREEEKGGDDNSRNK